MVGIFYPGGKIIRAGNRQKIKYRGKLCSKVFMKPALVSNMGFGGTFKFVVVGAGEGVCEIMEFFSGDKPAPKALNFADGTDTLNRFLSGAVVMASQGIVPRWNKIR